MNPWIRRLVLLSIILLIPLTLLFRKGFGTLTDDPVKASTLERLEAFFDSRQKIEKFLNQRELSFDRFDKRQASSRRLEEHISWSLERAKADPLYQNALSEYANIINDPSSAKEEIKQAVEQSARMNIQLDKPDEALKICRKALEMFPKDSGFLNIIAEVYYLKAASYQSLHIYELAVENLETILALDGLPQNWLTFTKNCLESVKTQQHNDAGPSNLSVALRYELAEYHIRKKDFKKAGQQLQDILSKYPRSSYVDQVKEKLDALKYERAGQ